MKKTLKLFGTIVIAAAMGLWASGCASQPEASPGGMTLDQAIAEAAARIDERIPTGSRIALLNFSSPSDRFSLGEVKTSGPRMPSIHGFHSAYLNARFLVRPVRRVLATRLELFWRNPDWGSGLIAQSKCRVR